MNDDGKREVVGEVLDAFNRHDLDAIMSHFAEDCVFESPRGPDAWGRRFVGKDEVRRGLAARFEGIPDVQYGDDEHFVSGNRGASEWTSAALQPRVKESKYAVATSDLRRGREAHSQGFVLEDPRIVTVRSGVALPHLARRSSDR